MPTFLLRRWLTGLTLVKPGGAADRLVWTIFGLFTGGFVGWLGAALLTIKDNLNYERYYYALFFTELVGLLIGMIPGAVSGWWCCSASATRAIRDARRRMGTS